MLKTCTVCHQQLPTTSFSKHSQKKDGLNSWCRECEKKKRIESLARNPLCCKCKERPHIDGNFYCYACDRKRKGKGAPRWVSRRADLEWCKICEHNPRLPYHQYCAYCKREYNRKWWEKNVRKHRSARLRKLNARAYATGLLQNGKIKRGPCVFCGSPGTAFHHYDYEDRTRNFDDVCRPCHDDVHRFLKRMLTIYKMQITGFASAQI